MPSHRWSWCWLECGPGPLLRGPWDCNRAELVTPPILLCCPETEGEQVFSRRKMAWGSTVWSVGSLLARWLRSTWLKGSVASKGAQRPWQLLTLPVLSKPGEYREGSEHGGHSFSTNKSLGFASGWNCDHLHFCLSAVTLCFRTPVFAYLYMLWMKITS